MALCAGAAIAQPDPTPPPVEPPPPVIPAPHPTLTEVMFNVPRGAEGDATGDGSRDAAGDEFVELYNPHDEPIDLRGYTLTNWLTTDDEKEKRGVRFTFPRFRLGPGETVVVFNGVESRIGGAVGSPARAPRQPNASFGSAWVFRMGNTSANNSFNNNSDFVLLTSADGEPIEAVAWGNTTWPQIEEALRIADVGKNPGGSAVRTDVNNTDMWPHVDVDGRTFSPGEQVSEVVSGP
ncbi:MAG: lamin tail domain-containing protein [Planctomycetota bacterium]